MTVINVIIKWFYFTSVEQTLELDPEEHMAVHKKKTAKLYATIQQNINSPDPVWKIKPLKQNEPDVKDAEAED